MRRHDSLDISDIERLAPERLVISPGPGTPGPGRYLSGRYPLFCRQAAYFWRLPGALGHRTGIRRQHCRARNVMQGKPLLFATLVKVVFSGLTRPLTVTRYRSLVIDAASVPSCWAVTAWNRHEGKPDEIMAIHHTSCPLEGVQFHSESILSQQGHRSLANFLAANIV